MSNDKKILVDANIWSWYFNKRSKFHTSARRCLNEFIADEMVKLYVNPFLVIEVFHYLIKKLGPSLGKQKAIRFMEFDFIVVSTFDNTLEMITQILDQLVRFGGHTTIGGRDASVLVTMKREGINTIVTHDQAFYKVPSLTAIDPIKT